ncbi:MAG: hypothetical protein M3N46_09650 [Actinomycetota bacterium]|nr:hypothetical protein [Actinomycetota bacterium]
MAQQAEELSLRVLVVRSGGIAGIRQQWLAEPVDDAEGWLALIQACPWGAVGADSTSRDRFVWRIEARMPRAVRTASVPDSLLVGPWRLLVDRVQQLESHG